jgi:signal transduction histidine kinase
MTISALLIAVAVANLFLGFVVYVRKSTSLLHYSFMLLTLGVAGWGLGIAVFLWPQATAGLIYYVNWYYAAALLIATALYGFSGALRDPQERKFQHVALMLGPPLLYIVITLLQPEAVLRVDDVTREVTLNMVPYTMYGVFFSGVFILACTRLFGFAYQGPGRRYRLVNVAILLAGLIGILFNLVLPALGNYSLIWVGPIGSLLLVITLTYSILRGRLFDIRGAIARIMAYSAAVFIISISLGWGVSWFVTKLEFNDAQMQLAIIGATVVITMIYPYVKQFFDTVTDEIFYQKPYDTQEAIDTITGLMVQVETVDELLEKVATRLQQFVSAESVTITLTQAIAAQRIEFTTRGKEAARAAPVLAQAFMLAHEQRVLTVDDVVDEAIVAELNANSIAMVSQLRSRTGLVGYLLFGYKQNGSSYTKRDTDFIDIVSDEFAIAIQSMLRFQEISEFNVQLKQRVDAATAELRVTNEKLQSLDKSKDEFISMASHQLRTPLTSVKGYISMILDGDVGTVTKEQRQLLQQAYDSSQRMVFLIGDFLNVSRLQTGKFVLEMSDINLAELAQEEVEQLTDTAKGRDIVIEYKKPAEPMTVNGDENKLRQVMMNFIDNAIFYSVGGKVTVQLHKEAGGIVFKVVDTGIGVPKSEQPKLFTKFFRATNARQQRPDGTGIGLYMAKKVVVAHGGTIVFDSKEGKGSMFGFRLPLKDQLKQLDQQPDASGGDGSGDSTEAK